MARVVQQRGGPPYLLIVFVILGTYLPHLGRGAMGLVALGWAGGGLFGDVVLSIGAGIYEELVFRLLLVGLGSFLLRRLFPLPRETALVITVLVSAALFSAYHYLGQDQFEVFSFVWRTAAGVYLGTLFAVRGFGIAAGAHACFDIFVSLGRHAH